MVLINKGDVECPHCNGSGVVPVGEITYSGGEYFDPPEITCPVCSGNEYVSRSKAYRYKQGQANKGSTPLEGKYTPLNDALDTMKSLLAERVESEQYQIYLERGKYKDGEKLRAPAVKGAPEICNAVAMPVRYDIDGNETHVLCWVPQSDRAAWISLVTGKYDESMDKHTPKALRR